MTTLNRHFKYLFAFTFVIVYTVVFSQVKQQDRFEKENTFRDEEFVVISLQEEGIALVREKNKYKSGKKFLELILLDTTLKKKDTRELEIDVKNELTGYEYSIGYVHLLFIQKETKGKMTLVSINLTTDDMQIYDIQPELTFVLTQFCKAGDNFVFGGYVNLEPVVLHYTPSKKNIKIVQGFFMKNTELIDMRANQNQTFNTVLLEKGEHEARKIIFRTFDSSGKQLFDKSVYIDQDISLQNGISSTLMRDDLMIMGTWGKRNAKQATGFYTLPVNSNDNQQINRICFGQLTHYLDYLKPKKAAKIKSRTLKALDEGGLPDFTSYVMPFKIMEHKKGFLMLAESYIPGRTDNSYTPNTSPYDNSSYYTPYGSYYRPNRVYDPYYNFGNNVSNEDEGKNIHGALIAYDPTGKILWDYSIKLEEINKPALQQTVEFYLNDQNLYLLYKQESDLIVKKIELSSDKVTEFTEKIQLSSVVDEVRSENKATGEIKNWFRNTFYVWGYQSIRNKNNVDKTRDVFYINKVVVN